MRDLRDGRARGVSNRLTHGGCEQPDRPVATRARGRGRSERGDQRVLIAGLTPGSAPPLVPLTPLHPGGVKSRGSRGAQGGLNCLTHALPRCLPTPNSLEADGNGYIAIAGWGGPLGRRLGGEREPSTTAVWTGVRHHPPGRTDKNLCRCVGALACRVFPAAPIPSSCSSSPDLSSISSTTTTT